MISIIYNYLTTHCYKLTMSINTVYKVSFFHYMLNGRQRATFFFFRRTYQTYQIRRFRKSTNFSRHASFVNGVLPLNLQTSCKFKAFLVCRSQPLVFVINCSNLVCSTYLPVTNHAVKRPISPAIPLSARRKPGCINENKTKTAKRLDLLKCSTAYLDECSENRTT